MKHILLATAALLAMTACTKNNFEDANNQEKADYIGTLIVNYNGENYPNEGTAVSFTPSKDGKTAMLLLHKMKFVPKMPVRIDVTVPNISIIKTEDGFTLSCERVVPIALGGEFKRYTVTNLSGTITGSELSFKLNFGDYPTSFKGTLTTTSR